MEDENVCDEECVRLIVSSSLLGRLTSSSLYPHLFNTISRLDPAVVQLAAEQLEEAGHPVHAATLQARLSLSAIAILNISILPDVT